MRIVLIRHAKVDFDWERQYDSEGFDLACDEYNDRPIVQKGELFTGDPGKIYISTMARTRETAELILPGCEYEQNSIFNEVPNRSFMDTGRKLPKQLWAVLGRIQWYVNSRRQHELRENTKIRARKALDILEKTPCTLISHEIFLRTLVKEMKMRGYREENAVSYDNLSRIVMTA